MINHEQMILAGPDLLALAGIGGSCLLFLRIAQKGYLKKYLHFLWAYLTFSLVASLFFINDIIRIFHPENTEQYIPRWLDISEGVFIWLIPGLIIAKLVDKFFWGGIITDILKHPPPAILRYATYAIILFSLVVAIVTNVFESSMTGLLATSGLLAGIVGFAMQLNLSNMFAAIAINIDRPFTVGDWIGYKDIEGEVIKITWRATKIKTRNQNLVSIPNRSIIYEKVENFCAPFHCDLMNDAKEIMKNELMSIVLNKPIIPIIQNTTVNATEDTEEIKSNLVNQVTATVRWRETMMNQ